MAEQPTFQRSPRFQYALPQGEVDIPQPPPEPQKPSTGIWTILPAIGGLIMIGAMIYIATSVKQGSGIYMLISAPIMLFSFAASLGNLISQKRKYKKTMIKREARYYEVLEGYKQQLEDAYKQQQDALHQVFPDSAEAFNRLEKLDRRLWERSPKDADFLAVGLGAGVQPISLRVKAPKQEVAIELDPLVTKAQELSDHYAVVKNVPIPLPLKEAGIAGLAGTRSAVLDAMRTIAVSIAITHSPDEVKLVAVFPAEEKQEWQWLRWLPHTWTDDRTRRLLADDKSTAHGLLTHLYEVFSRRQLQFTMPGLVEVKEPPLPYYVIFLSDPELAENEPVVNLLLSTGSKLGAVTIFLADNLESLPKGCTMVARVEHGRGMLVRTDSDLSLSFKTERTDSAFAEKFARAMAPLRLKGISKVADIPNTVSFLDLWNVADVDELEVKERWSTNRPYESLAVPIGLKGGSKRLLFDLHEKAHGPHGLVAGATGSGKSELLMSIISALAVCYHPHEVAFILVDYKGGGMANAFLELPHLIGVITNLQGNLTTRALIALKSELKTRQQYFSDAGVNHIDDYQKMYRDGRVRVPLPHLILIIDEFAELASEQPDFMQELISAVRVGRSLGVHLILATQKPAGVVNEQIWGNTKFRLCLRVERPEDSREVLKRPDAANITLPGRAYLQVGNDEIFELFQSAYGGVEYSGTTTSSDDTNICEVTLDGSRVVHGKKQKDSSCRGLTEIQAVEKHLHDTAEGLGIKPLPGPWLPPLPEQVFFDDMFSGSGVGWNGSSWNEPQAWIQAVVGIVDDPDNQSQRPLGIPLGTEGHMVIQGVPGCGKTTLMQTMIRSLSHFYSPENVNIYLMDFGGRTLSLFSALPHVGDVVTEDYDEKVRGLFKFLLRELEKRKGLFANSGVNTLPAYRHATNDLLPAVVVFLDNYANFATQYMDDLEELLGKLVQEGGNVGIHFVITATGPTSIRAKILSNISLAVALELSELGEYGLVVGRTGGLYPANVPGRGLVKATPPLEFQGALPAYGDTEADRAQNMKEYAESVATAWNGPCAPPIPLVPDEVLLADLIEQVGDSCDAGEHPASVYIGLDAEDVQPFVLDLDMGPHFLITGPPQCGKTVLLQTWLLALCRQNRPEELRLILVDFGMTGLAALKQLPHCEAYVNTADAFGEALSRVTEELQARKATKTQAADSEQDGCQRSPLLIMAVDDFYLFKESIMPDQGEELERIIRRERGSGFHLLLAGTNSDLASCWDGYVKAMLELQTGFLLGSTDHDDLHIFKLKLPADQAGQSLAPGLGYFTKRGRARKVKIALPQGEGLGLAEWTKKMAAHLGEETIPSQTGGTGGPLQ